MPAAAAKSQSTDDLIAEHMALTTSTDDLIKSHSQDDGIGIKSPTMSIGEAAITAANQGLLQGASDEVYGAYGAARDKVMGSDKPIMSLYRSNRDASRGQNAKALEDWPTVYRTVEGVGSVGTSLIGGSIAKMLGAGAKAAGPIAETVSNAPKYLKTLKDYAVSAGKAATSGGIQGFNTSNADLTRGDEGEDSKVLDDMLSGATISTALHGGIGLAGKAIKEIPNLPAKIANVFLNTPEELTNTYIKNPQGVRNARPIYQVAQDVGKSMEDLKADSIGGSKVARQALDAEGVQFSGADLAAIPKAIGDDLEARIAGIKDDKQRAAALAYVRDLQKELEPSPVIQSGGNGENLAPKNRQAQLSETGSGPVTGPVYDYVLPADTAVVGRAGPASDVVTGRPIVQDKTVTGSRLKDMIQTIDRNTEWDLGNGQVSKIDDQIKQNLRAAFDARLKGDSKAYENLMKQVASDTDLLTRMRDIVPTDARAVGVYKRVNRDQYGTGQLPEATLQEFDKRMGTDYLEQSKLSLAKEGFDKSVTNGSQNVNKFTKLFERIPIIGPSVGALTGAAVDKYGRKMTMGAVDTAQWLNGLYQDSRLPEYRAAVQPLINQAKKGNAGAVLTLQFLTQENPDALQYFNQQDAMKRRAGSKGN